MLRQRVLVVMVLLPIGLALIYLGGAFYNLMIAAVLGLAAWEYARIFQSGDFQPSIWMTLIGVLLLALGRAWNGFESAPLLLSFLILASMTVHLAAYERGRGRAASDFAVTISGIFYIGWLGTYLISLRDLPNGIWWVLLVLPAVWLADTGAYFVGRAVGKHKFSPRLSPKKTWEGYFGGIIFGTVGSALLAVIYGLLQPGVISPLHGAALGLILSLVTPLGDLGESMIKRQFGVKDSSHLIPGHGGVFDRIDSWLWAGVIGFYIVQVFALF